MIGIVIRRDEGTTQLNDQDSEVSKDTAIEDVPLSLNGPSVYPRVASQHTKGASTGSIYVYKLAAY